MKGFASEANARAYLAEAEDLAPRVMFFTDPGPDLDLYFAVAALLRRHRYCFVNSFARPLVDGWLCMLDAALAKPGVGQVGATGAWKSGHSWWLYAAGLPSAYRGLMPPVPVARELFRDIDAELKGTEQRSAGKVLRKRLGILRELPRTLLRYEPFPARFLRTSSFMITHACLSRLRLPNVHSKSDAHVIEGGRASITSQLRRLGLTSLVVDRRGVAYEPQEWHRSRTLWQGQQEDLLVADNQTHIYANGSFARRQLLSTLAWGAMAEPAPPEAPDETTGSRAPRTAARP
jgi:hypothetical protein